MKPIHADTCVDAWLQGCDHLLAQEQDAWRDYNLVSEIANPLALPPGDRAVVDILNRFLVERNGLPFSTVVNTIFPAQLYQRHGAAGVYERYVSDVLPHVLKHPDCAWGTYAQRILCRVDADGKEFSPLKALVAKLKSQLAISGTNRGTYELGTIDPLLDIPIYDPASSDRNRPNGGPCLSHISVKLTADHRVMLTAVYRSHYWVQRTLGNLFGLAHLQHFIAQEAGLEIGPLVCHSTMAQLETHAKRWNGRQVRDLVARCHAARSLAVAA
ncbi:hypothetical protein [Sphingomonas sp.]|uniref:hypothetical protein n=1 Tax=Sphingomonas sp. TaxID=28214 RepID=UPI003B003C26